MKFFIRLFNRKYHRKLAELTALAREESRMLDELLAVEAEIKRQRDAHNAAHAEYLAARFK